ncbi:Cytochrome P450 monooxygenase 124 [Psilocybe cubensis]|uniref:Cytochrome P450 monooxygenase 124 n=2 Tax=Psilocybe cubensis TaxID=181762 RepID=A0ACB8GSQ2_PSICU|nr:Cytochrome P450 monooxygenase 124 [Psilocybe cubensis]KAH9478750.1 Cytochrome P450 monooxygenase 124 [Psilocybe cubensis]
MTDYIHSAIGVLQQWLEHTQLTVTNVGLALLALFVTSRVVKYRKGLRAVSYMPGFRIPFHPLSLPAILLPKASWNPNYYSPWTWRYSFYKPFPNDTISVVPYLVGSPTFYTTNVDVARQVSGGGHKCSFYKTPESSAAFLLWGMNIVAADKETWRKHRRIVGPAFNNSLYQMVWTETLNTYNDMVEAEGWKGKKEIDVPVIQTLTFKLALLIIGKCGFGFSFDWSSPPRSEDGSLSIQEALRIVADSHMIATFLPKWIQNLPTKKFKEVREAHGKLLGFMKQQVAERRAEVRSNSSEGRHDAFTMLVKANEDEGKLKLSDDELIGNVFVMLFAGHETTAHTLAATLGYLAYHQNLQDEVYDQIASVLGRDREPTIDDYPSLNKVLAAFYEGVRLFPAGHIMIRQAYEDTVLNIPNPVGEEGVTTFPVPKGTNVIVDMIGVQYNPRYFDNPGEYRPSRWYGISNESESFSAFSIGTRACLGRKFATLESVCFLALLLRDYRVEPALSNGETKDEWRDRVLDGKIILTLGVNNVPVKLIRRV